MKLFFIAAFSLVFISGIAQISDEEISFTEKLKETTALPEKLLNTRTAVFHSYTMTDKDLENIQQTFQRTGIDAVAYFETDELLAGKDTKTAFAKYLNQRDIANIALFQKSDRGYKVFITVFNTKSTIVDADQNAWTAEDVSLAELLKKIYRGAGGGMKRLNMLINDVPEADLYINPIDGKRNDFFAIDLKVDELAVPKTGSEMQDKALEEMFSAYPFKYKFTEPGLSETELRKKGFLYVLCYIHTRAEAAQKLLGYPKSKKEGTITTVTFPDGEPSQINNFPTDAYVYKFYFKHIDSGNVFLGTKWDADYTWDQALKNHIRAFKTELKIN